MAFIVSDTGVAIISTDSDVDEVISLQAVGDTFYIDSFVVFSDAKEGRNPHFSIQLSTNDLKDALEEMGVI